MDLRSVLNTSDNGDRGQPKAPPTPKQQPPPPRPQEPQHLRQQQQQQQPRPSQSPAQYSYRDYARPPPQPSPGKPPPQEYPPHPHHLQHQQLQQQHAPPQHQLQLQHQQPPSNAYPPQPSPYQTPGPYPGRPAPPPLQSTGSFHDVRSPGGPAPAPSPYRPATTPSTASGGPGFPFPPSQPPPEVNSPIQRHQYPPAQYQPQPQPQRRESFSQVPQGVGQGHAPGPYMQQGQHPVPQTPPIGSAAGSHSYIHQRSQSTHSTPTPTSAQSQHQYGPPYAQASPVAASRPPPGDYSRAPSQPPTPVGPPLSAGSRQPSLAYAQPPSPYQQRLSSAAGAQVTQTQAQAHAQSSPPPPPPPAKRISTSYESPAREIHQRSQSHSERAPSASVSPKTRVPSLQSNPDFAPQSVEAESRLNVTAQPMVIDSDRAVTPAKRKLEDRDLSPKELEHRETRPPPGEVNGGHVPGQARSSKSSSSPVMPRKKRLRRPEPPIWAQNARTLGKSMPNHANFVLQKRAHAPVNGKSEGSARPSRHTSPETTRSHQASHSQPSPAEPGPQDILGPWEASITGVKPYEEMSKTVADWLFINVINNEDMQEIVSRGIQFEIEAKLGTLIDKDTNHRVDRLLDSECVLHDSPRIAFRSSMTEHKYFNDFLNQTVIQTDPRAPNGNTRVQVLYKHRREIDRFFELPSDLQGRLPGCMRARLGSRSKNVRVRVTYDQKTREVLGKIIKARVADINLHMPMCPMDCRISINLEMDWDGDVDELEQFATSQVDRQPDRNKDRLSYTHGHYQIDLTQVSHLSNGPGGAQRMDKEHELEIELAPGITIDQGRKAISGAPHRYQELVEGFVDNVRILARKAKELP
ncbi:CYTH-like domain-containing protein [Ilyonectria robusta]|uniref:CYTH-like domain-containing protein n=1 Tax=Ilyonectria robusta TaxID=1079257 RepID=UPI001E8EEB95|nr:CYTH-like domain-containing protein [Ilyonectria robusta]KAH8655947.1 CYTH-like domain-containing protein [Ilyonectria robusta]